MLELEEALSLILASVSTPRIERVAVQEGTGRVLLETVRAAVDLPGFDNSAMDGYAVRSVDIAQAGPSSPVKLRIQETLAAGEIFKGQLHAGSCVRLFTGSLLPRGADAVVMQEDTQLQADKEPNEVDILESVKPWENVRLRGEDVEAGSVLLESGERLKPGGISLLSASGIPQVDVGISPRVGLLATGSELREPGEPLRPGQIYESNRSALAGLSRKAGSIPVILPLVPDRIQETRLALQAAFDQCDALVTSGGVSVGDYDLVKRAFEEIGGELQFWRVAIRPGKPFVFGKLRGKLLFGLPGNPVSAFVTFLLLVYPALLRMQGARNCRLPSSWGVLAEPLVNRGDRRHFVRVKTDPQGKVFSTGVQGSHFLSSLATADGLLDVPAQTTIRAGTSVQVMRLD